MTQKKRETDRKLLEIVRLMSELPLDKKINVLLAAKMWVLSYQIAGGTLDLLYPRAEPPESAESAAV